MFDVFGIRLVVVLKSVHDLRVSVPFPKLMQLKIGANKRVPGYFLAI